MIPLSHCTDNSFQSSSYVACSQVLDYGIYKTMGTAKITKSNLKFPLLVNSFK